MTIVIMFLAALALANGAAAAELPPGCDVPESFLPAETGLTRAAAELKDRHRLDITVVGSGSSACQARTARGLPGRRNWKMRCESVCRATRSRSPPTSSRGKPPQRWP